MRVSQQEKEKTHVRIIEGATRLLRERGVDGTSVADVMSEAGLTIGGFYRHFETKDALLEEVLASVVGDYASALEARFDKDKPEAAVAQYRENYLSRGHVDSLAVSCPLAALGSDIARASGVLKKTFGAGVNRAIAALASGMRGSKQQQRDRAAREFAMLVGAVVIARASDPDTADAVLSACRKS